MFGSVFLGDPRQRLIANTSSPPSSPLPHGPPHISPEIALQLRIRWLEALLLGVNEAGSKSSNKPGGAAKNIANSGQKKAVPAVEEEEEEDESETDEEQFETDAETLIRRAEEIQRRLDGIIEKNDDLARFIENYDKHAHLFTPLFAFSHQNPSTAPSYNMLSSEDLDALLQEMEPDIREADRALLSIVQLEKQGVTGAGRLEEYEPLLPRLSEVLKKHKEDVNRFEALEAKVLSMLERYGERVRIMSELFVQWSDAIQDIDGDITNLETEQNERQRLGLQ
ncbi:hypothetical protein FRC19_011648 [Serendipita sp. 401]|nr:hypothetical protein FRC19_011648 [Serendipita sp. 401]KAG9055782.1 hypothetical protein FS842_001187 [Serendipita sp. 407]